MSCCGAEVPAQPSYSGITADVIRAQMENIVPQAQAEAQAAPYYNQIFLQSLGSLMHGMDVPETTRKAWGWEGVDLPAPTKPYRVKWSETAGGTAPAAGGTGSATWNPTLQGFEITPQPGLGPTRYMTYDPIRRTWEVYNAQTNQYMEDAIIQGGNGEQWQTGGTAAGATTWIPTEWQDTGGVNREWVEKSVTVPGHHQAGLMETYPEVVDLWSDITARAQERQAGSTAELLAKYGPQYMETLRNINPEQTALRDTLYGQAVSDLEAGRSLTPGERREVEQSVRSSEAARGMGFGPLDAWAELLATGSAGEQRYRERQQFAQNMIGLDQALYGDPFMQLTGRTSGATALGAGTVPTAGQAYQLTGAKYTNPYDPLAFDLASMGFGAQMDANLIRSQNRLAAMKAGSQMLGGIIGGLGGMGI